MITGSAPLSPDIQRFVQTVLVHCILYYTLLVYIIVPPPVDGGLPEISGGWPGRL